MRKWTIAASLLALAAQMPAQAQDRALREAVARDYTANLAAMFDHFHRNPELSGREVNTAARMAQELRALGYEVTTGVGPDLMTAAREAVARMIDLLAAEHGVSPIDAYMLLSVCGDLRISEIVDQPNWIVSFYFPRIVFT